MKIVYILHAQFETLGAIRTWAEPRHQLIGYKPFAGEILPLQHDYDMLILMGGPQSAVHSERYPYLQDEIAFIREAIRQQKHVLGICLGAQLIGEALGAKAQTSPHKEIGFWPITINDRKDPTLQDFPAQLDAMHWHNDMPGLPPGAQVLAQSSGCPRQIIRFQQKVYGLQCHLEMTKIISQNLIEKLSGEMHQTDHRYVCSPHEILNGNYNTMHTYMHKFLERFKAC